MEGKEISGVRMRDEDAHHYLLPLDASLKFEIFGVALKYKKLGNRKSSCTFLNYGILK